MEDKPKVLVIGSGGVGSMTAFSLVHRDRSEVTLVVRSDYDLINANGYEINSCTYGHIRNWKPHHLSPSVSNASRDHGPFDYVVLTTKNIPDGPMRCEEIVRPAITPNKTTLLLVQNGLGIEKAMHEQFPGTIVLSGVTLIASSYDKGVVTNLTPDELKIGDFRVEENQNPSSKSMQAVENFIEIYQNDNNLNIITHDPDPQLSRWLKLVYNCAFNTITALVGLDSNRCQIAAGSDSLIRPAMRELIAVAASAGVHVSSDLIEKFCHLGDGLFYTPSMAIDKSKGQLMELEVILGYPLEVARANGVETPVLNTLYSLLKMSQFQTMEARGDIVITKSDFSGDSDHYQEIFAQKYRK